MKKKLLIAFFIISYSLALKAQYTKILDFAGAVNGNYPKGDLIFDGTFLYGLTSNGGVNNLGVIFKIKPDGTGYSDIFDFTGVLSGNFPYGSLIYDGTFLYGMTFFGGTNDSGTIFKIKPDGTMFSKLLDFNSLNGAYPNGSLFYDGTFLYGMTLSGGANGAGIVFKIKPDGTAYADLHDFNFSGTNGYNPYGSLIYDGTFLYGTVSGGGSFGNGIIFKIKPDGTLYTQIFDFAGVNGTGPLGSLVYDGTFLYGMTSAGGMYNEGVIFRVKADGTSFLKLLDFSYTVNGGTPNGSLIYDGNYLYGLTSAGGLNGGGVIFKIKSDGSGGFSNLHDFDNGIDPDGAFPHGSLISDGTCLYGMTKQGGINSLGTVFKYCIPTEISENVYQEKISIFPNPSNSEFNFSGLKDESFIEVFDVIGRKVYFSKTKGDTQVINLREMGNGIYFYKVFQLNEPVQFGKIVVK